MQYFTSSFVKPVHTDVTVLHKDQTGKLPDLVGFFGFSSRTMSGKSVKMYLSGIPIIQSVRSQFILPYKQFGVLLTC